LASASVSSKAIIAMLSKTRPIARMVLLSVRLFWLLRPRRERPRGRATKQRDEVPAVVHSITSSAPGEEHPPHFCNTICQKPTFVVLIE
jgi:hypothetical protein